MFSAGYGSSPAPPSPVERLLLDARTIERDYGRAPPSPIQQLLLDASAADNDLRSGTPRLVGSRPLDDLFERGRRQLREISANAASATKTVAPTHSSGSDLQRQLQEWRKDADAKKRTGNIGLLIPPRMCLDRLDEPSDAERRLPGPPADDVIATRIDFGFADLEREKAAFTSATSSTSRRLGARRLGNGLATTASAPSLHAPDFRSQRDLSSPPQRRAVSPPPSGIRPSADTMGLSSSSRASDRNIPFKEPCVPQSDFLSLSTSSDRNGWGDGGAAFTSAGQEEVAALRRYLAAVQKEVRDRDHQLEELAEREREAALGGDGSPGAQDAAEVEEWLQREEEEVQQLEAALAEADLRIRESEEQLQLDDVLFREGIQARHHNPDAGEAPSLASTAPTGPPSAEQVWQERARALERDIRCEAAQALELQDRIHWLRTQLNKQPSAQDSRILSIREMFGQIQQKLEQLNSNSGGHDAAVGSLA